MKKQAQPAILVALRELAEPWQEKGILIMATRESGRRVADELLRRAEEPGDIILDFDEVAVVTLPFLQELMGAVHEAIVRARGTGRIIVAVHLERDVADAVRHVLESRKQTIAWCTGKAIEMLAADDDLAETLRQAQGLGSFTAPELAERLSIAPDTATQRLKRLLEGGAVVRERDPSASRGIRHLYHAITGERVKSYRAVTAERVDTATREFADSRI